ncbi:MAG: hypothetical protein IPH31_25435 [Lewinellaceae bacterium]|nr:hypothetical protein [Lewinellaceae bacterium]
MPNKPVKYNQPVSYRNTSLYTLKAVKGSDFHCFEKGTDGPRPTQSGRQKEWAINSRYDSDLQESNQQDSKESITD